MNFMLAMIMDEPTQLLASWDPPDMANGVIIAYTLSCSVSSNQVYPEQQISSQFTVFYSGDTQSARVSNLTAFTSYDCSITASTSAGMGELSEIDTATTDESSKY